MPWIILWFSLSRADDDVPPVTDPIVLEECGGCHMAFQPGLLPARSWILLMSDLGDHFGEDATVQPDRAETITTWMVARARRDRGDAPLRITEASWWKHEHEPDEVSPKEFESPRVKSAANCMACHEGAERGHYDDD